MPKLQILAVVTLASFFTPAADATEGCRYRVSAIRAELAAKQDRLDLERDLATAEMLCKRGKIDKAVPLLADIVARLRNDG